MVGISSDNALEVSKTIRQLGVRYLLIADPAKRIIQAYGVLHPRERIARPAVFVIDKSGVVRYAHVGRNASDRPSLSQVLQALAFL